MLMISLPVESILHKVREAPPERTIEMINLAAKLLSGRFQELHETLA